MKPCFLLIFSIIFYSVASAQQMGNKSAEGLQFKEIEYNFGKIAQGKPVYHFFEVVNNGKTSLALQNVAASCGCTTPEWSREEIKPGASTAIKIGFNAMAEGEFEKYITVLFNNNQTKVIKIKGEVWKVPQGAAPANASVQFLKQQLQ